MSKKPSNVRGPKPQSFYAWVRRRACKDEIRRFRCTLDNGVTKVALVDRNAVRPGVRMLESMKPVFVEALDDKDNVLGTWELPENQEPEPEPAPGYTKEDGDSEPQRDLKVVAHLISDAYKVAIASLKDVIRIQSDTFTQERKYATNATQGVERVIGKLQRLRVRVPSEGDDERERAEPAEDENAWLEKFVGNLVMRKMAMHMNGDAGGGDPGDVDPDPTEGGTSGPG
jgi:hypothetical protein